MSHPEKGDHIHGAGGAASRGGQGGPWSSRRLAERAWLTLARGEPSVVRDLTGRPVTPEQAKQLIAERVTVPTEVRRRRSGTKAGKAPHMALKAQGKSQHEAGHEATFPTRSLRAPNGIVNQTTRPA
jgi:hypothetical protein